MSDPRAALVAAARRLAHRGLSPGSSGNLSVRLDEELLITPTGIGLSDVEPGDLALVRSPSGEVVSGRPSNCLLYTSDAADE